MEYEVKTPGGNVYSKHKDHSEALKHVGEVLKDRGIESTHKNAMDHGFSIKRNEHGHPHSEDPLHKGDVR